MQMHSKINGSTFCGGQRLFKDLEEGDVLNLIPEPENKFDNHAVRVENKNGEKLGYLPRATAQDIFDQMSLNVTFMSSVAEITGKGKDNIGCNILIWSE